MYVRGPEEEHGRITSLALKEPATVIGDGISSLRELIDRHPHSRHVRAAALREHRAKLDAVPPEGERLELAFARNRCGGAICRDGHHLITPELTRCIDEIARSIPSFCIGRFDVRFASAEDLRAGEAFAILELNCGPSEPLAAWDPRNGVADVSRAYFDQVDLIYEIGAANRALGHSSPGTATILRAMLRQLKQSQAYSDQS